MPDAAIPKSFRNIQDHLSASVRNANEEQAIRESPLRQIQSIL